MRMDVTDMTSQFMYSSKKKTFPIVRQNNTRTKQLSSEKWYTSPTFMSQIHYVHVISVQHI
jgi:hypothetical protein